MKKTILMIGGIVVLVILLGGAAFIGGRLLNGQGLLGQDTDWTMQLAEGLPQTPADVEGVFDHRQDKSISVGTGNARLQRDENGNVNSEHDGPTVEIVVTTQTTIYKDVTMRQYDGPPPEGQTFQQVVEAGTLDEIAENSMIQVRGMKTGDRYIADVLLYTPSEFIKK